MFFNLTKKEVYKHQFFQNFRQMANKENSYTSPTASPFLNQYDYKERAELLFNKLNTFQESIENEKYKNHQKILTEISSLQQSLNQNLNQKKNAYQVILDKLSMLETRIDEQKTLSQKNNIILDKTITNSMKQCDKIFEKLNKERSDSQKKLMKLIDNKIQILQHRNKTLTTLPYGEDSLISSKQYLEELKHLKQQIQNFYDKVKNEEKKILTEFTNNIHNFKQNIKAQLQQDVSNDQPIIACMKDLHVQIAGKVQLMKQKRQSLEQNVLNMLEKIVAKFNQDKTINTMI